MAVKFGSATLIARLPYASTAVGTTNGPGPYKLRVLCDNATAINVTAVGTATTGAVYAALITCNRASY
jgi:hypothetical protein